MANSLQGLPDKKHIIKTLDEIRHPKPVEQRSGDEIASEVIEKIGLKFKED